MPVSREFNHDLGMWERWFLELSKHPVYDPDLTAKALALYAFYYCDHAGHTTLSAPDYAAAIEAIIPNSSAPFNVLLGLGEWERWVAAWAGMHIKFELTHHKGINRLMGMLEHRYIEPISPRAFACVVNGGCKIYQELTARDFNMELSSEMNKNTIRDTTINHPLADMTWEEARNASEART